MSDYVAERQKQLVAVVDQELDKVVVSAYRRALSDCQEELERQGFACSCDHDEETGSAPCALHTPVNVFAELTSGGEL